MQTLTQLDPLRNAITALRSRGPIHVRDTANVATSFPGFTGLAATAGVRIADADLA